MDGSSGRGVDFEKFRLRPFVKKLVEIGEVEVHEEPVALADMSAVVEKTPKAVLFKKAGAEQYEVIAAVSGSRKRVAAAFGVGEGEIAAEFNRRVAKPQPIVEVKSADAPVHEIVRTGDQIDLTTLPFHPQHQYDGGTYISSAIDFSVDPATGKRNVGCRRLMLRSKNTMRTNLTAPSDLRACYKACVERKQQLPISFVIGSHPLDFLAASGRFPADEFAALGTLRGEAVPMVKSLTNDILVPADAELVIEGYLHEHGYTENEGPYGEFWGFYGPVHIDPVFHVTAITQRKDIIYQTVLHSGRALGRADSSNLAAVHAEAQVYRLLREARIAPVAMNAVVAAGGRVHLRLALKSPTPGQARAAISTIFAISGIRNIAVFDDDVNIFDNDEVEWAMSTRMDPARDVVIQGGMPGYYTDPVMLKNGTVSKIGYDCTMLPEQREDFEFRRAWGFHASNAPARYQTVQQALESGPMFFSELMEAVGSKDGREVALSLDTLRENGTLTRLKEGQWALKGKEQKN
ncbi:MAG TPA: UbiD family decarboxylase [Stellaceae bacterium]|jgi:UbiD family decarboxylase|nr:UbiD family decarboxylase [Stellaceae bacterium]